MKIKTKLTLGVGLLFLLIILLSLVGSGYINALKSDTDNILAANYNTLEYARNMLLSLDDIQENEGGMQRFEENLQKQITNETEVGEKDATNQLSDHFSRLKSNPGDSLIYPLIRQDISEIMRLNMEAIQRKSTIAAHTAQMATLWIVATGTLCFIIAFVLLINLPGNIANPISELTESIRQIAAQNYHQRVHFEGHNEFGGLARSFNTMAEKLEEYAGSNLSRILMGKKRIETLINNMHDPVIGLDENMKVLFANDEALKISGLKEEEIVNKAVQDVAVYNDLIRMLIVDIVHPPEENKNRKLPIKIYADQKESYFEKEIVHISITPTGEHTQQHIGHVIILKNITPFKELDFARTNFIATVSHELKTPISSIKMTLQLLSGQQTGALNNEQRQLVESIREDSDRLLKITGELLNMSQLETGNMQLNIQPSNPYHILHYALDTARVPAEQKKVNLVTDAPVGLPDVKADADKTAWVLINFLTNAIRYAPEQSDITIRVARIANSIVFSVRDLGKGIEPRYQHKIFDRYFQIPGSAQSGTGLGLAISKEFIEAQGGTIGVETETGMGSLFYFKLPVS